MPIYEYRCPDGHTFEVFQRFADAPSESCEVCGKSPVEKVLFPVAVHFKGSGFYATDYGKGGRKAGAKDGDAPAVEKTEKTEQKDTPAAKDTGSSEPKSPASD
jgi:putative FmdB family regulatory protein